MDHFDYRDGVLHAEDVPVDELAARFGTPLFVYSRATFERHFRVFDEALASLDHLVCYAVKANSNLAVLNVLARQGAGFDIVSRGELERVLAAGGQADRIVFSGVGKRADEMEAALQAGIRSFNVESEAELDRLSEVASNAGKVAPVALRVNPDVDAKTHPYIATGLKENKFGIDMSEAERLFHKASQLPGLQVTGLDCHIGSQLTEVQPFLDALALLLQLIDRLESVGIELHHLNLGGGLGIRYQSEQPPQPAEYAKAILPMLEGRNLQILVEPGRAIAGNAGILLTKVEYLKPTPHRNFAIVDAAMSELIRPSLYNAWQKIIPACDNADIPIKTWDIVGPVCETGDWLGKERELALSPGDLLAVRSSGAYGFVMSSNYNSRPRPAEVMVDGDKAYLVRKAEQRSQLYAMEEILPRMKPLILIDGSSWLYRAFHALPRLSSPDGLATGAVLGMGNMLKKLLKEFEPDQIAVVFDPRGKTFRHEQYADYKANRPPVPPELTEQFDPICRLIDILGLPRLQISGVEADDVIATLARHAAERDQTVLVVSGDKDLAQIVSAKIQLLDTMKDKQFDAAAVEDKYGVKPQQIVDWLALMGDSSDNVPGIPGVGAKTAAKWLGIYGDLDSIVQHSEDIKGKIGDKLRAHLEQLPLARDLVTVRDDLTIDYEPEDLQRQDMDRDAYAEFCRELGFSRWLDEVRSSNIEQPSAAEAKQQSLRFETVMDKQKLEELAESLRESQVFAVDTETDGLDPHQARLIGLSFAIAENSAYYLPLAHDYLGAPVQLSLDSVQKALGPLLADTHKAKIAQHGKFDMHVLARHGMCLHGLRYDTMLESYVLNANVTRHDMDSLAMHYLGHKTISFSEVAGKGKKQLTFNQIELETAAEYAAEDAAITFALHRKLNAELQAEPSLAKVYNDIEQPLIEVLQSIEANGVLVSRDLLATASAEFAERMQLMETQAHELAGASFNLNSPAQLKDILFDQLQLPVVRKTPKGAPSTAEDVLQELADQHELPQLVLDWRALAKLRSTYTEKLPGNINPHTGRIHTSYHQAVAATGRLSSADPNLQNIPIRNDDGRRIRQAFIAPDGCKIAALDYSQIELRLMAHFSGDRGMIEAFSQDQDIHSRTAAEVFDLDPDAVESQHRRAAKAINFGLIYGISAFGLARNLGISRGEAQEHMDRFFNRYPGVARYMEDTREKARENGYVETLYGRRLYLREINDRNQARRQAAERVAINAPLQGTAADIIKLAMIAIHGQWVQDERLKMIMQVHDELVFEIREDAAEKLLPELQQCMERVVDLKVPLKVDPGLGDNWNEAHE